MRGAEAVCVAGLDESAGAFEGFVEGGAAIVNAAMRRMKPRLTKWLPSSTGFGP